MKERSYKISVVVPVYKVEAFLPACIESILAQSLDDFELILIDDGSPDGSGKICDEYAKRDNRITVIHNINQGVAAARNCGVMNSSGDWITFVDSDDTLPINALEFLYNSTLLCDCGIVVGYLDSSVPISKNEIISADCYRRESIVGSARITSNLAGKLYHHTLFKDENAIKIPREVIQGQDMLANIKLSISNEKNVILIPHSIYIYRQNPDSRMHTFVPTIEYVERFHELLLSYISEEHRIAYRSELVRTRIASLGFITKMTSYTKWVDTQYFQTVKRDAKGISLNFKERLLLSAPFLYLVVYKLYRLLKK